MAPPGPSPVRAGSCLSGGSRRGMPSWICSGSPGWT